MAARQQGHMHGRPGLAAGAAGRPATREQLVGALLHASRQGRARTRSLLLLGTRRGARASRATVSYALAVFVLS
jgi:hypothetical protein